MSYKRITTYGFVAVLLALAVVGCTTVDPYQARRAVQQPAAVETGWSRIYVSPGFMGDTPQRLWTLYETGPVYVDNQLVEVTALNEYFIVDVKPGVHEMYCATRHPYSNYSEKMKFVFRDGETRYLECDMVDLGGTYATKTYFRERPPTSPDRRLIGYHKLK